MSITDCHSLGQPLQHGGTTLNAVRANTSLCKPYCFSNQKSTQVSEGFKEGSHKCQRMLNGAETRRAGAGKVRFAFRRQGLWFMRGRVCCWWMRILRGR